MLVKTQLQSSFNAKIFWVLNALSSVLAFMGLAYNLEFALILIQEKIIFVPIVYVIFVAFFVFNIVAMIKGFTSDAKFLYKTLTRFFVITAWITVVIFGLLVLFLLYFGLFVETNHDVYLLSLIYVVGFVGPMFLNSLTFLGLHHARLMDAVEGLTTAQPLYVAVEEGPKLISSTTKGMI